MIRWIAMLGVAALLLTGTVMTVPKHEEAGPQQTQTQQQEPVVEYLTEEQAKAVALAHAQLEPSQVTFRPAKFEKEDGRWEWEVEFYVDAVEYDYTIDAQTGQILKWEKDMETIPEPKPTQPEPEISQPPATQPPETQPPATQPPTESLTAEQAKAIALEHAGLNAEQVTNLRVRRDRDDGIELYEVEFRQGRVEYEYEIHSRTGKILDWDKDIDD